SRCLAHAGCCASDQDGLIHGGNLVQPIDEGRWVRPKIAADRAWRLPRGAGVAACALACAACRAARRKAEGKKGGHGASLPCGSSSPSCGGIVGHALTLQEGRHVPED